MSGKGKGRFSEAFLARFPLCPHCEGKGECRQLRYRQDPQDELESCRQCKEAVGGDWQKIRVAICLYCDGMGFLTPDGVEKLTSQLIVATKENASLASAR